jgi:uncharacterized protein YbaR (Trm112 family)
MREAILELLRCPVDLGCLEIEAVTETAGEHAITGTLRCDVCGQTYPIVEGVPNMLPERAASVNGTALASLQQATDSRFGYEWLRYHEWGWLREFPDMPNARARFLGARLEDSYCAFRSKTLLEDSDLSAGQRVLDAGCGNGRFSYQASRFGEEVVAMDLSHSVGSALKRLREQPNVHIVREDTAQIANL